jgi:hypothetical protein
MESFGDAPESVCKAAALVEALLAPQ